MAEIAGFRGLLYDASKVEMSKVLAPPYDVIDDAGRAALAEQDAKNCVRIIVPEAEVPGDAKYDEALSAMEAWQREGVIVRDEAPAIYRYHQVFKHAELGDTEVVRRGFIAAVRLHGFDEGVILRHERTLKGPKVDRLKLWERTRCHLSQIFTLYSDPESKVDALFVDAEGSEPTIDGTTEDGTRHLLWRVTDEQTLSKVRAQLDGKPLYIADGHHRYETMLALRNQLLGGDVDGESRSSAAFGMMFLANIDDPGLVVLPTHRMIHNVADFDAASLRNRLSELFSVEAFELSGDIEQNALAIREALARGAEKGASIALVVPGESRAEILTLRSGLDLPALGLHGAKETLALDVTLLHGLVLEGILGIDKVAQEAQSHIDYIKDTRQALELCQAGDGQACFLMNATPVSQVVAVADVGEVMPQKSTFFYPKIASGIVFKPIAVDEVL
ncbi:MAG: DUF1015 domain-containing protein [Myxococcales bacterium]|nr:DUF1015 domain-containing protein [Myxococcales bacterium]